MKKRMFKILSFVISVLLVIGCVPIGAMAQTLSKEENSTINNQGSVDVVDNMATKSLETDLLDDMGFQYQESDGGIILISYIGKIDDTMILKIPESIRGITVKKIEKEAFKDNRNIKEVIIPKGVNEIDETIFAGCVNLEKISVEHDNAQYYDENGKLYQKDTQKLIIDPENIESDLTESVVVEDVEDTTDNNIIGTMEQIPGLSEDANIEQQVVILYKNGSNTNISGLSLEGNEVKAGERVSNFVDIIELNENINTQEVIKRLSQDPNVLSVDKNEKIELTSLPNDPYIANGVAWQFKQVGADKTWNSVSNATPVVVAVLDTGLNTKHPDLQGRITTGYDYYTKSTSVVDLRGHGTLVSGCVAAVANNNTGIAGIAGSSNVKIAPYRVGGRNSSDKYLESAYICAALQDVTRNRPDIKVINMSFGSDSVNNNIKEAIRAAAAAGKVLVASAGNGYGSGYNYPASYDNVISVGATTRSNKKADFSQFNDRVDLCAPGQDIYSTSKTGGYEYTSGTSFSSPITAGACAVLLAANSKLTAAQVENTLKDTALDLGSIGRDNSYGSGLVQIDQAIKKVSGTETVKVNSFQTDKPSGQGTNSLINLSVSVSGGTAPYQYKFYYKLLTTTQVISNFSSSNKAVFKPASAGIYTLYVDVKDAKGNTCTSSIANYSIGKTPGVSSFTTSKPSGARINTSVLLTATGSGGKQPYQYKFTYTDGSKVITLRDYSYYNTATFIPPKAGTYALRVSIRDSAGAITTKSINKYIVK